MAKDSQDAQTAVAQALTLLKEFYAKAGEATAFLQQQPEAPEILMHHTRACNPRMVG